MMVKLFCKLKDTSKNSQLLLHDCSVKCTCKKSITHTRNYMAFLGDLKNLLIPKG